MKAGRRPLGMIEDLAGLIQEEPSRVGEPHPPLCPLEEADLQLFLEAPDLLAERGLGDSQAAGRAAKMQLVGKSDEVAEMSELHGLIGYTYQMMMKNNIGRRSTCARMFRSSAAGKFSGVGGGALVAIAGPWWSLAEQVIRFDQNRPGAYELGSATGTVVYIGSAADVQRRLLDHLKAGGTTCLGKHATQYRVEYTGSDPVARARQLYDEHVRALGTPPACNEARP
jgi:hypothetical protein